MKTSGYPDAQSDLGVMYRDGTGVAQSNAKALDWFRKAADNGFSNAQYSLGAMYAQGQGVAPNLVLAHMWISLALAQGQEVAGKNLAVLESHMTKEQIAEAQRLTTEWKAKHPASTAD